MSRSDGKECEKRAEEMHAEIGRAKFAQRIFRCTRVSVGGRDACELQRRQLTSRNNPYCSMLPYWGDVLNRDHY